MNNVLSLLTSACGWLADPIGLTRWTQTGKSQPSVLSPATGPDGSFFFFRWKKRIVPITQDFLWARGSHAAVGIKRI